MNIFKSICVKTWSIRVSIYFWNDTICKSLFSTREKYVQATSVYLCPRLSPHCLGSRPTPFLHLLHSSSYFDVKHGSSIFRFVFCPCKELCPLAIFSYPFLSSSCSPRWRSWEKTGKCCSVAYHIKVSPELILCGIWPWVPQGCIVSPIFFFASYPRDGGLKWEEIGCSAVQMEKRVLADGLRYPCVSLKSVVVDGGVKIYVSTPIMYPRVLSTHRHFIDSLWEEKEWRGRSVVL